MSQRATNAPKPKSKVIPPPRPKGAPAAPVKAKAKPKPRKPGKKYDRQVKGSLKEDLPELSHESRRMRLIEYVTGMYELDPELVDTGKPQTAAQCMIQAVWRRAMRGDLKSTLLIADWIGEGPKQQAEVLIKDAEGNPVSGVLVTFSDSVPPYRLPDTDGHVSYAPQQRGHL